MSLLVIIKGNFVSIRLEIHNPTTSELTYFKCQKKFYSKDPFVNHVSLRDRARAADPAFFFLIDLVGFWAGCRQGRGIIVWAQTVKESANFWSRAPTPAASPAWPGANQSPRPDRQSRGNKISLRLINFLIKFLRI